MVHFIFILMISLFRVSRGLLFFITKRKNSEASFQSMIRLFCYTRGWSNEFLSSMISIARPFRTHEGAELWERKFSKYEIQKLCNLLEKDGVCVLDERLPARIIKSFIEYTSKTPATLRPLDYQVRNPQQQKVSQIFDSGQLKAVRYEYDMLDLAKQPFIQEILSQSFFKVISGKYLGTTPVLDIIQCWWHTSFGGVPDENAAQKYHFDMDRLKWLKVFIYLTDVGPENGPHCFIRGSHRPGKIPWSILKKGYARVNDSEVLKFYSREDFLQFHGVAGTIILEDTRGLHKGLNVNDSARLMFELQFSNSLFGAPLLIQSADRIISENLLSQENHQVYEYIYKAH